MFREILNLEGHLNRFIGSKVTAILVNRGILPSGGVASGRVCACSLHSRLFFFMFEGENIAVMIFILLACLA